MDTAASLPIHLEERATRHRWTERGLLALAAAFVAVTAANYGLATSGRISWTHLWPPAAWVVVMTGAHLVLDRWRPLRDPLLLPIAGLLTGWGLVLVRRLAPPFAARQALWVLISAAVMLLVALWPRSRPGDPVGLRWLRRYRYTWLVAGLGLLGLTFIWGVNPSGEGPRLWLGGELPVLGGVYFQPSELLKLLLVVFLASYMAEKRGLVQMQSVTLWRVRLARPPLAYLSPLLVMWGLCLALLAWQRDLGAATLFFLVFVVMVYLASGRWEAAASGGILLVAMLALAYWLPVPQLDVVRVRVDTWLNPWPTASGTAFQVVQSLLALAAGGLLGEGVGQGFPTYVPVVHSDFTLAAVAEEWGLLGSLAVVACLAVLVYRGFRLGMLASRPFTAFLAAGISSLIGLQSLIIMGGATKMMPLTGVTLPFLSYGGSSLLICYIMVGLLIKVSGEVLEA